MGYWNKGLTKETNEIIRKRISENKERNLKISLARKRKKEKLGYINSSITRKRMSETLKGRKLSDETKRKISEALKGKMPKNINQIKGWNKGMTNRIKVKCKICGKIKEMKPSGFKKNKTRHFFCDRLCSNEYFKENPIQLGKKHTEKVLDKISKKSKEMWSNKEFRKRRHKIFVLKRSFSEDDIINLWKEGFTLREIGKRYKYGHRLILKEILLNKGVKEEEIRDRHKERLAKARKKDWMNQEYKINHLSKKQWYYDELKEKTGEKSINWKGGLSFEPYDKSFNSKFKRLIRTRDNYICMLCEIHSEKLNCALHIHHIDYDKLLTIPQNCISLCRECHLTTNKNRKHWTKFFQSLLSEKYGYEYNENQEIVLEVKDGR